MKIRKILPTLVVALSLLVLAFPTIVFAESQDEILGLEDYTGYGCCIDNGFDYSRPTTLNDLEEYIGLGCDTNGCGQSREAGYSPNYPALKCRNWQIMPLYTPFYKYSIDMDSLNVLSESDKNLFIKNVREAAEIWNSTIMHDKSENIVMLIEASADDIIQGVNICPIMYEPNLPAGISGRFTPIPIGYKIEIKRYQTTSTILHEMGHLLGLQDLDMNRQSVHNARMGYARDSQLLHYQDIQGLAVANNKHTKHVYTRYFESDGKYKNVCFYCDLINTQLEPIIDSQHFIDASICTHDFQPLVSAGELHWFKCTKCYKVVESEYYLKGIQHSGKPALEITGVVNSDKSKITIPRKIGDLNVVGIADNAFYNNTNLVEVEFESNSNILWIGNNAFAYCNNLNEIDLPSSITKIGNNAFNNCNNLTTIIMYDGITEIGANAFSNCVNLLNINLPNTVQYLGNGSFMNCETLANLFIPQNVSYIGTSIFVGCNNLDITISTMNTNYYVQDNIIFDYDKTTIISAAKVPEKIFILESVLTVSDCAFERNPNVKDIVFLSNPKIGIDAFNGCSNLTKVYFNSLKLPLLEANSFSNNTFILYVPFVSQDSYRIIFLEYTDNITSLQFTVNYISDDIIIDSESYYYGALIESLPVPTKNGYTFIAWYKDFEDEELVNGELWLEMEDICVYAKWKANNYNIIFDGINCGELENQVVTYGQPVGPLPVPEREGYTFVGWTTQSGETFTSETVYNFDFDVTLTANWKADEFKITFDGNGGLPTEEEQTVHYEEIVTLPDCARTGYTFTQWNTAKDGSGQTFSSPFIYNVTQDTTLYAQWNVNVYTITYILNGGTQAINNPSNYTIEDFVNLVSPTKKGNTFVEWQLDGNAINVINVGSYGDITLIAIWNENTYKVLLNANGGTLSQLSFNVIYGHEFRIPVIPTRVGYMLDGWNDVNGQRYATPDGECTRIWDKDYNATLTAQWSVKSYEIQINDNGSITWLGASGLSTTKCNIEYGTVINAINLIKIFKDSDSGYKEGKVFDHFEYEDETLNWTSIPDLGDNGRVVTIVPIWILEQHTIYFNTLCATTFSSIIANFDERIELPSSINRVGYIFIGWFTSATNGIKINWTRMPDLTPNEQNNGSITLFAQYETISYDINYYLDGGSNTINNPPKYTIESNIILSDPTKTGYEFDGWFTDSARTQRIVEINNSYGPINLYAKWSPIIYTLRYHPNGGNGHMDDSLHTYDQPKTLSTNIFTKTGYNFLGWSKTPTGNVEYRDSQQVFNLSTIKDSIIDLYAVWQRNRYTVVYDSNGGTGNMTSSNFTYDVLQPLAKCTFTRTGYAFVGWATTSTGNAEYSDQQSVNNLTTMPNGTVRLYAKWRNKTYNINLDQQGGTGGSTSVIATYNMAMPTSNKPYRSGYTFQGYYTSTNGNGIKYYNQNMTSANTWLQDNDNVTLYAYWIANKYTITFDQQGGTGGSTFVIVTYGEPMPSATRPNNENYNFLGYYYNGVQYYTSTMSSARAWDIARNVTLQASWSPITKSFDVHYISGQLTNSTADRTVIKSTEKASAQKGKILYLTAPDIEGYSFKNWTVRGGNPRQTPYIEKYTNNQTAEITYEFLTTTMGNYKNIDFYAIYKEDGCITTGMLITLANGSQIPVEQLTGNEMLLVWNSLSGKFDFAPILFIDKDDTMMYEVINLYFSDSTQVKVISEHGFWDYDLNQYVYLDSNSTQYIGHWFSKQAYDEFGNKYLTRVQLIDVIITTEYTTAYSPVTYGHLCYYVNGMLSMPGGIKGLFNIFEIDADTMTINKEKMEQDIETFGLYTYQEFNELISIPEEVFNAFNGKYMKIAIGKGLITIEDLQRLVGRYSVFWA